MRRNERDSPANSPDLIPTTKAIQHELYSDAVQHWLTLLPAGAAGVLLVYALLVAPVLGGFFLALFLGGLGAITAVTNVGWRFLRSESQANEILEKMKPQWEQAIKEREDAAMQKERQKLLQDFSRFKSEDGKRGIKEVEELTLAYQGLWNVLERHTTLGHADAFSVPRAKIAARTTYRRGLRILGIALTRMEALQRTNSKNLQEEIENLVSEIASHEQRAQSDEISARLLPIKQEQLVDVRQRLKNIGNLRVQMEELLRTSNIAEKALEDSITTIGDVEAAASDNVINRAAEDLKIVLDTALRVQEVLRSSRLEA